MLLLRKNCHDKHAPGRNRKTEYPVFGRHCNHLETVCRSKDKEKLPTAPTDTHNYEGGIFESLCVLSDITFKYHANKIIALDHHLYDHLSDTWTKK